MNEDEYINQRVDDQIKWYSEKSKSAQQKFKFFRGFEIVAAAAIPVIVGFSDNNPYGSFSVAVLGASIAVVTGFLGLNQYQEIWTEYRSTAESLKREKFLYQTSTGPYQNENQFQLFVERIEILFSKENDNWAKSLRVNMKSAAD